MHFSKLKNLRTALGTGVIAALIITTGLVMGSCGRRVKYHLVGAQPVYTLTNLHPDERRGRLQSVNYQEDGLIPLCTPVRIIAVNRKVMKFTVESTGRSYTYRFHKTLRDPIESHLDLYFGQQCPADVLGQMGQADVSGVQQGQVYQGMTKQGVIFAVGYPPVHETPNLHSNVWKYWRGRMKTFEVHFTNGYVTGIKE